MLGRALSLSTRMERTRVVWCCADMYGDINPRGVDGREKDPIMGRPPRTPLSSLPFPPLQSAYHPLLTPFQPPSIRQLDDALMPSQHRHRQTKSQKSQRPCRATAFVPSVSADRCSALEESDDTRLDAWVHRIRRTLAGATHRSMRPEMQSEEHATVRVDISWKWEDPQFRASRHACDAQGRTGHPE